MVNNYNAALRFFEKQGLSCCIQKRIGESTRVISEQGLDILRRQILDALAVLAIVEQRSWDDQKLRAEKTSASRSRLFFTAVEDVCSSLLRHIVGFETMSETLLRELFDCSQEPGAISSSDWMPRCWAVSLSKIEPKAVLEVMNEIELPKALKDNAGGTMMHLGAACRRFDANIMGAISSPLAACSPDYSERLPLHWATVQSRSVDMLDYLLALNPEATKARNSIDMTPMAFLVYRPPFPEQVEMLKYLARADPESCKFVSTRDGDNLFHNFALVAGLGKKDDEKDILALFDVLLELVPREYLLAANFVCQLPLHVLCQESNVPVSVMSAMIHACPAAVKVQHLHDDKLPVHYALARSSVENIKLLIDTYPEGADLSEIISSKSLRETPDMMISIMKSHFATFPETVRNVVAGEGYKYPLHFACSIGQLDVVKFLYEKYPDAIKQYCGKGYLPLHNALLNGYTAAYDDIIRFLVRQYPQAASMKMILEVDEEEEEEEWLTQTPIELAAEQEDFPVSIQRLLLCACPEADVQRRRNLNYEARRGIMFIVFVAISRQQGPESMVWQLRRLMRIDKDKSLLKYVLSYL